MSRSWRLFLQDVLESATKLRRYTEGMNLESFVENEMAYDAVLRNLEIIGEAVKNVPPEVRSLYPEVDWRGIASLRDVLAHAYFALDDKTLWDIIQSKVPELLTHVHRILEENP